MLVSTLIVSALVSSLSEATGPNVIIIMTDDQGAGDFGFYGNPVIQTPHLDALAENSARLKWFYVSPTCTPTRAALMTGRAPQRTRAFDTWIGRALLDPEELTLAEILGQNGFATGIFGKWHLGDCPPMRPIDQGFEESLVHRGGGIGQPADPEGGEGRYTDPVLFHNGRRVETQGYCTDVYFDAAIAWMRKQAESERPFFAYIPTNAPHGPFHDVPIPLYEEYTKVDLTPQAFPEGAHNPLPEKVNTDRLARIYAMITNIDQNVGRLMGELEEIGILNQTLVIFLCDNGPDGRRYNRDLRGSKTQVYEGGVRSPFFAHWPSRLDAGMASDRVASHLDVFPTVLEACDIPIPTDLELDGRSVLGLLEQREIPWPERTLVIQNHRGDEAVRYQNFLVRTQKWKLVHANGFRPLKDSAPVLKPQLFDIEKDPFEAQDLAAQHPDLVHELLARYEEWFEDVCHEREDNFAPPPIHLGPVDRVVLTRQDWRRTSQGGWGDQGRWSLDVLETGPYRVRIRFLAKQRPTSLMWQLGDLRQEYEIEGEGNDFVIEDLSLPLGKAWLQVLLRLPKGEAGPYQIEISRPR